MAAIDLSKFFFNIIPLNSNLERCARLLSLPFKPSAEFAAAASKLQTTKAMQLLLRHRLCV
jgi:hypothetical protein